jgi:exopolysaccharide biosynthesis polyprenyl glycosylphosphotransferase
VTSIALVDEEDSTGKEIEGIPIVARGENSLEQIKKNTMDAAFLFLPDYSRRKINQWIEAFETMGVTCYYSISDLQRKKSAQSVSEFAGHLVISYEVNVIDYRRQLIKRMMDIVGSLVGMIFTVVLTPFIALAIKLDSPGPVFFAQIRIGKNGRRFRMYKFRSMYADAEERKQELLKENEMQGLMFKMENDPRITPVGRFLRKTSLDELPQFYNVLKGEMSLVGTRPPTLDEFEHYSMHYRRRLSITPGLTGMWQVSGRSDITDFEEVVKLDLEYIDNWSLTLDCKILLQTILVVIFGRGSK